MLSSGFNICTNVTTKSDCYYTDPEAHACSFWRNSRGGRGGVGSLLQKSKQWKQKANPPSHGAVIQEQKELDNGRASNSQTYPRSLSTIPGYPNCGKFYSC